MVNMETANLIVPDGPICNPDDPFSTRPRTAPRAYKPADVFEKIPWDLPMSIFKDYRFDSIEFSRRCFEFDWKHCKMEKFIRPAELEEVKSTLFEYYDKM